MNKLERLRNVLTQIKTLAKDESNFESLEKIRKEEYQLEGGKDAVYVMGNYRHNLEQTGWKQAESYKEASRRRPIKGAPTEFKEYIDNFIQDVSDELNKLEYQERLNNSN